MFEMMVKIFCGDNTHQEKRFLCRNLGSEPTYSVENIIYLTRSRTRISVYQFNGNEDNVTIFLTVLN